MFQEPEQEIVELQHFREDHVRIRFREPSAAQAAYENMKADKGIFVGSDLAVSIRQSMHQAVHALSEAGLHVRMAGNMVKYRQEMEQPWQYVNPRDLTAIDTISTSSRHAGILQNARQCQPRRQTPPSCTGAVSSHKALEELVQPGGGVKRKGMTATGFSPKPRKRERAAGEQ